MAVVPYSHPAYPPPDVGPRRWAARVGLRAGILIGVGLLLGLTSSVHGWAALGCIALVWRALKARRASGHLLAALVEYATVTAAVVLALAATHHTPTTTAAPPAGRAGVVTAAQLPPGCPAVLAKAGGDLCVTIRHARAWIATHPIRLPRLPQTTTTRR